MRTINEIYDALVTDLVSAGGVVPGEGGDMALRLRAVAAEIFTLEAQADFVARQSFPQTAVGEYLDGHAALRGLTRGAAQKAAGTLRFSLDAAAAGDVTIPAGTECMTAAGVSFVTTAVGTIAAGGTWCGVAAEASEAGSGGNVPAGTIVYMKLAPTAVSAVTNAGAFTGGTDGEDDEALRARVLQSYRTLPNGANAAYYESKVLGCDNVEAVTVLPKKRGVGTVDVVFATYGGVPTAAEVAAVQALLDSEREICVDIAVSAPMTAAVNVAAALTVADGYGFAAVKAAAEAALTARFDGAMLSKPVYRAGLCALLMAVEGVENCTLSAPAADVAAVDGTLPVLGTVTISEA